MSSLVTNKVRKLRHRAADQYRFAGYRCAVLKLFKTRATSFDPRRTGWSPPQAGQSPTQLPLLVHETTQEAVPPAHMLEHPYVPPGNVKKSPPTAPQVRRMSFAEW